MDMIWGVSKMFLHNSYAWGIFFPNPATFPAHHGLLDFITLKTPDFLCNLRNCVLFNILKPSGNSKWNTCFNIKRH
jgi:hypothetical protein